MLKHFMKPCKLKKKVLFSLTIHKIILTTSHNCFSLIKWTGDVPKLTSSLDLSTFSAAKLWWTKE